MKLNIKGTPEELAAFVTSLSSHKPMDSLMNKLADEIIRRVEEMEGNCQSAARSGRKTAGSLSERRGLL